MGFDAGYRRFKARVARDLAFVRAHESDAHRVTADKDWGKSFRSRPGSADYKAHCTCGWTSSRWYYDEEQAVAGAARHLREANR
jgi:hypothetical protein